MKLNDTFNRNINDEARTSCFIIRRFINPSKLNPQWRDHGWLTTVRHHRSPIISFIFLSPSLAWLATRQRLQSCRAQPTTANSQHLVRAGAVRSYGLRRGSAPVDAAWQIVTDCWRRPHRVLSRTRGEQTVSFRHGGPLKPAVDPLLSNQTALVSYDANS